MGIAYLAVNTCLERKSALKFLPPRLQGYQIARQRFLLEAKSAAGLDHPYICKIREISRTDDGQASIALGPRVKMGISS
jgi:serine/threonine-protein kinase